MLGSARGQSRWQLPEETQPPTHPTQTQGERRSASGQTGLVCHWPRTGFWVVDSAFGRKTRMEKQNPIRSSAPPRPEEQIIVPTSH